MFFIFCTALDKLIERRVRDKAVKSDLHLAVNKFRYEMDHCDVILHGKSVGSYSGGLPSGWKLTSTLGSVLNCATILVAKRLIYSSTGIETLPWYVQGDDTICN